MADVLTPFAAALVLAYLLEPLCRGLERLGLPRALASLGAILVGLILVIGLAAILVPMLQTEFDRLKDRLPGLVAGLYEQVYPWLAAQPWLGQLGLSLEDADAVRARLIGWLSSQSTELSGTLLSTFQSGLGLLVSLIGWLVLVPVVLFFLLKDWLQLLGHSLGLVPQRHRAATRVIAAEVHETLRGYLQGQGWVMLAMALFYSLGLLVMGLESWLSIGLLSGLLVFIPYAGFVLSLVLALGAGVAELGLGPGLFWVGLLYGLGQLIEGFVLTPKLVGDRIGLHPLAVIFALLFFGSLFGFLGVLVALPLAAVLVVLGRRLVNRLHDSPDQPTNP